uniref:ATP-dependent NAD(P)H-hydrate dehydratase n=1 Tax=Macrostomum lignano TaxID=282301 RepID=A0A1I8GF72_9PLAT
QRSGTPCRWPLLCNIGAMSCTLLTSDLLLSTAAQCIPAMSDPGGLVCIVGGSASQPGPAHLAALAALRAGADQAKVVCADSAAAAALRGCWPQPTAMLEVGAIDNGRRRQRLIQCLQADCCQAVLVGPGLDSSEDSIQLATDAIETAQALNQPLVIDG